MRLVNPKASTFLAIFEFFAQACACVNCWHMAPARRSGGASRAFRPNSPMRLSAEGKFETYLHERENAKKPRAVRLSRPRLPMINCSAARRA
jgi:hypothetical protein